ncbi:hypothetical protein PoB_006938000 [Plakobranchus ocellatus]|uniref:F5/8 type C domain-containing protein n=1 Tax=Plakobranchus ocellatus TaxID=259542 RepID=A0AAV4DFV9_9GAST|nr:hypothetical protein PoB_006938000 [Plakobranchus ocellatus]
MHTHIYTLNTPRTAAGQVSSVASSSWSASSGASNMLFSVAVKGTDHSDAGVGSSHTVTLTVTKDGVQMSGVPSATVRVVADSSATSITDQNMPVMNMSYAAESSDTAIVGMTVKALADIQTFPNTLYMPFSFEAIMPNISGEPLGKICKVELHSVGRNTPCILNEVLKDQVQLLSSFDASVTDRAVLTMSGLCNLGLYNDTEADHAVLAVSFSLLDHSIYATDPDHWISMGVTYSSSQLWVGQMLITADTGSSLSALTDAPNLAVVDNNGAVSAIPLGYTAKFLVRIKFRPGDFTILTVNVSTTDDALSVCDVRLVRVGSAYPCFDSSSTVLISDVDTVVGVNRKGSIDMGYISSVGSDIFVADDYYDENTIELEVTARLTSNTGLASEGSTHNLNVEIKYDPNYASSLSATATVTATTTVHADVVTASTVSSAKTDGATLTSVSITGSDANVTNEDLNVIVLSESKRMLLTYETERSVTRHLQIQVSTPDSDTQTVEVVYMGLVSAGANLACVHKPWLTPVYSKRTGARTFNDLGTLDLGYVCNSGTVNTTEADTIDVALSSNAATSYLVVSRTLEVGDVSTYVDFEQVDMIVQNNTGIVFNSSESSIVMPVASYKLLPLVFLVPPYTSSKVYLDVDMPVNTSAILTIESFKIIRYGRNLHRFMDFIDSYSVNATSRYNTTQITNYALELGVITNTGVMTSEPDYTSDDDTFTVEVTVQMADSGAALHGTSHSVSVGLSVAKYVFILDIAIEVDRSINDLIFNMSSAVDNLASNTNHIEVDTILSLSDLSTAEGQDTTLMIFHPPYVSCQASLTSDKKEILSKQQKQNSLSINIGQLFFTDEVHIKTVLDANSSFAVPVGLSGLDSVLLFQPIADKNDGTVVPGDFEYVNVTVSTTTAVGTGCTPGPLGLESGLIQDCQISSSPDSISSATQGRYNSGTGWTPFVHYGAVRQERYFQVYFGNRVMVNKIKMQQTGTAKATKVTVRYSNDGMAWVEDPRNTMTPDTAQADQELDIPMPESARYIRVMITDLDDNSSAGTFKFELVGCNTTMDGPADLCSAVVSEPTTLTDFKRRTFLVADTKVYVCSMIHSDLQIKQKCYHSSDRLTWTEIDDRVGSLTGYDSEEPRVYGVSSDGLKHMSSMDGNEWVTSVPQDIVLAKAKPTFKYATEVPHTDATALKSANPDLIYRDSSYGATMTGIKYDNGGSWDLVFSWGQCCP